MGFGVLEVLALSVFGCWYCVEWFGLLVWVWRGFVYFSVVGGLFLVVRLSCGAFLVGLICGLFALPWC